MNIVSLAFYNKLVEKKLTSSTCSIRYDLFIHLRGNGQNQGNPDFLRRFSVLLLPSFHLACDRLRRLSLYNCTILPMKIPRYSRPIALGSVPIGLSFLPNQEMLANGLLRPLARACFLRPRFLLATSLLVRPIVCDPLVVGATPIGASDAS